MTGMYEEDEGDYEECVEPMCDKCPDGEFLLLTSQGCIDGCQCYNPCIVSQQHY